MRIATWNVNSMKARLEKIEWWLERAAPDVLLMQETKLSDADAPLMPFQMAGYQLVHHGEGRWNGVAIAVRDGIAIDEPITNFGDGPVRDSGAGATVSLEEEDFDPSDEARMLSVRVTAPGGDPLRVVSLYAPERPRGRLGVLRRQAALVRPGSPLARCHARPGRGAAHRR